MKLLRTVVASVGLLLMGLGYGASQSAFFGGTTAAYTTRIDQSMVPYLSLALLASAVALAFIPEKGSEDDQE